MDGKIELPEHHNIDVSEDSDDSTDTISKKHFQWNEDLKQLLKQYGEKAMGYRWIHDYEADYYTNYDKKLKFYQMTMLSLTGTITGGALISMADNLDTDSVLFFVVTVVKLLIEASLALIVMIREYSDYIGRAENHKKTATEFRRIYHDIKGQFVLVDSEKESGKTFLISIMERYDTIMETALTVRPTTLEKYLKYTENQNVYKPTIVDDVENIDINNHVAIEVGEESDSSSNKDNKDAKEQFEIDRFLKHL